MREIEPVTEIANGDPSKAFFIHMITRDITLSECLMDLLDNCVDGINNFSDREGRKLPKDKKYRKFKVAIDYSREAFKIQDDCGGIPIEIAKQYAFRFGRPDGALEDTAHLLGLYGIGMKRALFKMGKRVNIKSSTGTESFELDVNVDEWRRKEKWDFELTNVFHSGTKVPMGTTIEVKDLYKPIANDFAAPNFTNALRRSVSRVYAFILQQGLQVRVNKEEVRSKMPTLKEGKEFSPFKRTERFDGVMTEIVAGLSSSPPEDDSAEKKYPDAEMYGWYVVCNDRVVVTADKTSLTGWGVDPVSAFHNQYYGFVGVVRFDANDPKLLPWRTTKSGVDVESPIYKKALALMKEATQQFIDYTNKRKPEIQRARASEKAATDHLITGLLPV